MRGEKRNTQLPNIATMLMRFMAKLNGRSASPRITATWPSPPPGTQATHSNPNLTSLFSGNIMAIPKASWKRTLIVIVSLGFRTIAQAMNQTHTTFNIQLLFILIKLRRRECRKWGKILNILGILCA